MSKLVVKDMRKFVLHTAALCLSVVAPLVLIAWYLSYSRGHRSIPQYWDTVALVASLVLGTAFLFFIPMKLLSRFGAIALYAFVEFWILVFFSLTYGCYYFGDCL